MSTAPDTSITTPSRIHSNTSNFKFLNAYPNSIFRILHPVVGPIYPTVLISSMACLLIVSFRDDCAFIDVHPLLTPSVAYFVLFRVVVVPLAFLSKLSLFLYTSQVTEQ